jgi:hypothetical protein
VERLQVWSREGAQLVYISAHRDAANAAIDDAVLRRHDFPDVRVEARQGEETYADVVAREAPDVLVEDDCESVGEEEMTYPQLSPDVAERVTSIVVREFEGLEQLPDDPQALLSR